MEKKRLTRSSNKMIGGVCAGIAEFFDVDPTAIRVAYAALTIFTTGFPGVFLYILLLIIMQKDDN